MDLDLPDPLRHHAAQPWELIHGDAADIGYFSGKAKDRLSFTGDKTRRFAIALFEGPGHQIYRDSKKEGEEYVPTRVGRTGLKTWVQLEVGKDEKGQAKEVWADVASIARRFGLEKSTIESEATKGAGHLEKLLQDRVHDYQAIQEFSNRIEIIDSAERELSHWNNEVNTLSDRMLSARFPNMILNIDLDGSDDSKIKILKFRNELKLNKLEAVIEDLDKNLKDDASRGLIERLRNNQNSLGSKPENEIIRDALKDLQFSNYIGPFLGSLFNELSPEGGGKLSQLINNPNLTFPTLKAGLSAFIADLHLPEAASRVKVKEGGEKFGDLNLQLCRASTKEGLGLTGEDAIRLKLLPDDDENEYAIQTDGYIYAERPKMTDTHVPYSADGGKTWVLLNLKSLFFRVGFASFEQITNLISEDEQKHDFTGNSLRESITHRLDLAQEIKKIEGGGSEGAEKLSDNFYRYQEQMELMKRQLMNPEDTIRLASLETLQIGDTKFNDFLKQFLDSIERDYPSLSLDDLRFVEDLMIAVNYKNVGKFNENQQKIFRSHQIGEYNNIVGVISKFIKDLDSLEGAMRKIDLEKNNEI